MQADDSIAFASEAAFQKLAARLDAAAGAGASAAAGPRGALGQRRQYLVALRASAAWGALAGAAGAFGAGAGRYVTLTTPSAATAGGAQVRVVFAPNLTLSELERLLHSIDAYISDGPTEAGVFTLTLSRRGATLRRRSPGASPQLRADANVRFAEPVGTRPRSRDCDARSGQSCLCIALSGLRGIRCASARAAAAGARCAPSRRSSSS